jgi:parallel beta-helix repeat protein
MGFPANSPTTYVYQCVNPGSSGGLCSLNSNSFGYWNNVTNNNFTNFPGFEVGENNYIFNNSLINLSSSIFNIYSLHGNNTFDHNVITRANSAVMPFDFYDWPVSFTWDGMAQNITSTNTIDGKPVLYYSPYFNPCPSNSQMSFGNTYGEIGFVNCTNITVTNTNFYSGALIGFTNNSVFNNFSVNNTGIVLSNSTNNTFENSFIFNVNGWSTPMRLYWSNFNMIINNNFTGLGFGFDLYNSNNNLIQNNFMSNYYYSLDFLNSNNNYIDNITTSNTNLGNYLTGSSNDTIINSRIDKNLVITSSNVNLINNIFPSNFNLTLGGYSNYTQLNTTLPNFNFTDSLSNALIQWFLNVYVSFYGTPRSGIIVNVSNGTFNLVYQATTSPSGYTGWNVLSEMLMTNNSNYTYAPYTVNASDSSNSLFGSNSTSLTSSQVLDVTLNLISTQLLEITSIAGSPSKAIYPLNDNISLVVSIYNSGGSTENGNVNVTTYNNTFLCPFTINALSSSNVQCGWVVLNSTKTVVTASVEEPAGQTQRYSNMSQPFFAYSTSNIVVPDSNILVILALAFASFFAFKNKLKK